MPYLWKSMKSGLRSGYNGEQWKIGEWKKIEGKPSLCQNGFHASKNIIDAMQYTNLENLARVEVRGKSKIGDDKQVWTEMRVVKAWKWTKKDSVALAIYAAELVIDNFEKEYPDDKRPRNAIEAAKTWLKDPTRKNQSAAESARSAAESARGAAESARGAAESARGAAWSAASAAWSVAASAAESAAESAAMSARSAAGSAAMSARSAAGSAAMSAAHDGILKNCHKWIVRRTKELEGIK